MLFTGGVFGSVIREFWNFWGSNIVAPKVFAVAGELVGSRQKSEQWQRRQAGEAQTDENPVSLNNVYKILNRKVMRFRIFSSYYRYTVVHKNCRRVLLELC